MGWAIHSDNRLTTSAAEFHKLKAPRALRDRTLFIECPNFPVMDAKTARFIAVSRLSDAAIGGCDKIVVRGKVWHYDFKTAEINQSIRKKFGRRTGMVQNPLETVCAGSFYDESRKLWSVPQKYEVKETIKFPAR